MKKIISMILALALVMSFGVTAFAAGEGDHSNPVTATYVPFDEDISVSIEWGSLAFVYEDGVKDNVDGYWEPAEENGNNIRIENLNDATTINVVIGFELTNAENMGTVDVYANWEVLDDHENFLSGSDYSINQVLYSENRTAYGRYNKVNVRMNLRGAPRKALSGEKIGEVVITISEYVES